MSTDFHFDSLPTSVTFITSRELVSSPEPGAFLLEMPAALTNQMMQLSKVTHASEQSSLQHKNGISVSALQPNILAQALLTAQLVHELAQLKSIPKREAVTEAAFFSSIIDLALVSTRPELYSAARLDCLFDAQKSFFSLVEQILGCARDGLLEELYSQFSVSAASQEIISQALEIRSKNRRVVSRKRGSALVCIMYAHWLSQTVAEFRGPHVFQSLLVECAEELGLENEAMVEGIQAAMERFFAQPHAPTVRLAPYLSMATGQTDVTRGRITGADVLQRYISEIKVCFKLGVSAKSIPRSPQVMCNVLEALVFGVGFRRALFLRLEPSRNILVPYFIFGEPHINYSRILQPVKGSGTESQPDVQAALQRRCIFQGDSIFHEQWPFVAFPVLWREEVQGVFYADMGSQFPQKPLSEAENVACLAISELMQAIPDDFQ